MDRPQVPASLTPPAPANPRAPRASRFVLRSAARVDQGRGPELRRAGWTDRRDAPDSRRREALGERGAPSARPQLLHAVARTRGAAARHLHRLASTSRSGSACTLPSERSMRPMCSVFVSSFPISRRPVTRPLRSPVRPFSYCSASDGARYRLWRSVPERGRLCFSLLPASRTDRPQSESNKAGRHQAPMVPLSHAERHGRTSHAAASARH